MTSPDLKQNFHDSPADVKFTQTAGGPNNQSQNSQSQKRNEVNGVNLMNEMTGGSYQTPTGLTMNNGSDDGFQQMGFKENKRDDDEFQQDYKAANWDDNPFGGADAFDAGNGGNNEEYFEGYPDELDDNNDFLGGGGKSDDYQAPNAF